MPLLRVSASDVTASVKAGAEVNAAVGGAVAKGGNSNPPRAGGSAAAAAVVTQSAVAKSGSGTFSLLRTILPSVIPRGPRVWGWSSAKFLQVLYPIVLAGSFDGSRILALRDGDTGQLYATTNGGVSFVNNTHITTVGRAGFKLSSDGSIVLFAVRGGAVSISSDGGVTRTNITPSPSTNGLWSAVTISSDGTKISVSENDGGYIYTSTRSGSTWPWTRRDAVGQRVWSWIVGSADGNILIAAAGGSTYRSTDSGATWSAGRSMGVAANVVEAYCSGDGSILFGRQNGTFQLFRSGDGGATWSAIGPVNNWRGCSMSADGLKMIAVLNGEVWLSETSGSVWTRQPDISGGDMRPVYISGDGNRIAIGSYGGDKVFFAANE
jgi:hypothetical protein